MLRYVYYSTLSYYIYVHVIMRMYYAYEHVCAYQHYAHTNSYEQYTCSMDTTGWL